MPRLRALAPVQRAQAEAEAQANALSGGVRDVLRQQDPISRQRQEQERPAVGHSQATSDVSNQDQRQSGAHPMDCAAEADSWSSAEAYCDAVEEHQPPTDEVVELSGDDDSSVVLSDSHAARQPMAGRAQAPDQDDTVSSRGQGDGKASFTLLSQPEGTEAGVNASKETCTFAAVTEMVSTSSASVAPTSVHFCRLAKRSLSASTLTSHAGFQAPVSG